MIRQFARRAAQFRAIWLVIGLLVGTLIVVAVASIANIPHLGRATFGDNNSAATSRPISAVPPLAGDGLAPGTYSIVRGSLKATITIPGGWGNLDQRGVTSNDSSAVVVFWPFPADFNEVYADPCHWKTTAIEPAVGPTVDDLANALAAQAMRGEAVPTAVSIDGHSGKVLEMSVPSDLDFADCDDGFFYSWAGRFHQGPGQIDRVYILDVDGTRQVFIAHHMPRDSEADLAEQQAIVDSIQIFP